MNVFSNLTKATHVSLLKARAEYLTDHTEGRARVIKDGLANRANWLPLLSVTVDCWKLNPWALIIWSGLNLIGVKRHG